MNKQPIVFLCGHRKSGTTLFRNLLDGHLNLNVYPNDLGILFAYFPNFVLKQRDPNKLRSRLDKLLFENQKESCLAALSESEQPYFSGWRRAFNARTENYSYEQLADKPTILNDVFLTFQAFHEQLGRQRNAISVFKETSIEINALKLKEQFPESKFIHLVRDPRANYCSLKSGLEDYYGPRGDDSKNTIMMSLIHRLQLSLGLAEKNANALGEGSYKILRFEDLVQSPKESMTKVIEWLGLEFQETLLQPTLFSKPTGSNNFIGEKITSIGHGNVDKWRTVIEPDEEAIINFFLNKEMQSLNYEVNTLTESDIKAVGDFYEWSNYEYFYKDFYE